MTDLEIQEFDSGIRMSEFFGTNNSLLKGNAKAVSVRAALDANIAVLEAAGANRVSATGQRKDGTIDKTVSKAALNALVRNIAETTKTIKKEEPDFNNTFKIPRGKLSGAQLLDVARGFFNDLTQPTAAKFAEYGRTNLPTKLTDGINAFETARAEQNTGRGSGVAATAQIKATIKSLKQNRRTLAKIVENILEEAGDFALLAEWQSACRIEKPAKKKSGAPPPTS